jgi:RNA 3'-terminal phosphate cyclase (ATP)
MKATVLDGSDGEGGGQILRTALALSLAAAAPIRVTAIRAGRRVPGLGRQHLAALEAAAAIGSATVEGASLGSREILFRPRGVRPGTYRFSVGTAGSATLVAQTVLLPLLAASEPSVLVIEGGTHNPAAPPFEFFEGVFLPRLREMGARASATLERPGFYPAGGGRIRIEVEPCRELRPIEIAERGEIRRVEGRALVARLPRSIAERELATVRRTLGWGEDRLRVEEIRDSAGPGNVVLLEVRSERLTELFAGFGARGVRAETVASNAAREVRAYLEAGAPVGPRLADQLLLPMAMAGGGSFVTVAPTKHTLTHIDVIHALHRARIECRRLDATRWRIDVEGAPPR